MRGQFEKRPVTVADIIEVAGTQSLIVVDEAVKVVADHLTTPKGWEMIGPCKVLSLVPMVKFQSSCSIDLVIYVAVDWDAFRDTLDWSNDR